MRTYNIGIIGAGHIAEKMGRTLLALDRVRSYAVASRSYDRARDVAARQQISKT